MVLEIGTTTDAAFSPSHSLSQICLDLPLVKELQITKMLVAREKFYLGAFADTLHLGIIIDVIAQELMSFTGSFP